MDIGQALPYILIYCFSGEFEKKCDPDLPFYHPSVSHRFREEMPSFDTAGPEIPRLHQVLLKRQEDGSIFPPGRAFIGAKGAKSVCDRFYKFQVGLPQVPQ